PDSVLLKPAKLTPEERRIMETHPRLGFDILRPFSEYAKVLDLVLSHHERYDGKGYPNGTVGRRLLLIAQVIPVADSLDAMTSARAYRAARSPAGSGLANGVTRIRVAPFSVLGCHMARTKPSTRTEPCSCPALLNKPMCRPSGMIRVRSAWPSRMLS